MFIAVCPSSPRYQLNASQPRVILGRWTGGCAVRWIDLSGVYTQRTCRNRLQPTMGLHFGSKRMAKLERSLWVRDSHSAYACQMFGGVDNSDLSIH